MGASIFEFTDYKTYLREHLPTQGEGRGIRTRLAEKLRCKPAFVTQVLNGKVHLSLEHAIEVDRFFEHATHESQYFMLMVFRGKAGSRRLENFFSDQMELLRRERTRVTKQVSAQSLRREVVQKYYSCWVYSATHVLGMVPGIEGAEGVSKRLGIPMEAAREAVEFLLDAGLMEADGRFLRAMNHRVHLDDDSTMIQNHHTNWRLRAVDSLVSANPLNLHYSGPIAVSRANAQKVRALLLDFIKTLEPVLADPEEEDIYGIALDFFLL